MAKGSRHAPRLPARARTRMHKPKLSDPENNTRELETQLRTLGLRVKDTMGDGNCLFRALCDQLYGSEAQHLTLRAEITDWMAAHSERYSGFVEDDRGLDDHLRCMRVPGTYGGHLELSAFAHLKKKNVKVIQPGLVYVIEWDVGASTESSTPQESEPPATLSPTQQREARRARREKIREEPKVVPVETVYVAYHDWEHFSSVRTLAGELPLVAFRNPDIPEEDEPVASSSSTPPPPPASRSTKRVPRRSQKPVAAASSYTTSCDPPSTSTPPTNPTHPLLPRSPSPSTNSSSAYSTTSSSLAPLTPSDSTTILNHQDLKGKGRSPKRTLELDPENDPYSSGQEGHGSVKRRAGTQSKSRGRVYDAISPLGSTPALSSSVSTPSPPSPSSRPPDSASSLSSLETSSVDDEEIVEEVLTAETPPPTGPPPRRSSRTQATSKPVEKPITRRQRKKLGLPKARPKRVILTVNGQRPGEIGRASEEAQGEGASGEWTQNGSGRLDVRGFRELKI